MTNILTKPANFILNAQSLYAILMESTTVLANLSEVLVTQSERKRTKNIKGRKKV